MYRHGLGCSTGRRKGTNSVPFYIHTREAAKPPHYLYPTKIEHIGHHIRKHRIDLGLLQKDVAEILGADALSIKNWELGQHSPRVCFYPKIISFLGYEPFPPGETFPERLYAFRMRHGLSYKTFGKKYGCDWETVKLWETGKSRPFKEKRLLLKQLGILP